MQANIMESHNSQFYNAYAPLQDGAEPRDIMGMTGFTNLSGISNEENLNKSDIKGASLINSQMKNGPQAQELEIH